MVLFTHFLADVLISRTLAEEEPEVISVAMRPGTVDTQVRQLRHGQRRTCT